MQSIEKTSMDNQKEDWDVKNVHDYLIVNDVLGKGMYGTVYKATKNDITYACKRISFASAEASKEAIQNIKREVKCLKLLKKNDHVVKLEEVFKTNNNIYLFMELCMDGDLEQMLRNKPKGRFSEEEATQYFKHIIEAFKDINANNILHMDMKPANILVKDGIAKISDFGLAKQVSTDKDQSMKRGTPLYMCPQMLQDQIYTNKCDVWSLGIMLYELLYGQTPWNGQNLHSLKTNILTKPLQFPSTPVRSPQIKELIQNMLKIQESERYSWNQVFQSPVLTQKLKYLGESSIINSTTQSCILKNTQKITMLNKVVYSKLKNTLERQNYKKMMKKQQKLKKLNQQNNIENVEFNCQSLMLGVKKEERKTVNDIKQFFEYQRNMSNFISTVSSDFSGINEIYKSLNTQQFYEILLAISLYSNINFYSTNFNLVSENAPINKGYDQLWQKFKQTSEFYKVSEQIKSDISISNNFLEEVYHQSNNQISKDFKNSIQKIKVYQNSLQVLFDSDKLIKNGHSEKFSSIKQYLDQIKSIVKDQVSQITYKGYIRWDEGGRQGFQLLKKLLILIRPIQYFQNDYNFDFCYFYEELEQDSIQDLQYFVKEFSKLPIKQQ